MAQQSEPPDVASAAASTESNATGTAPPASSPPAQLCYAQGQYWDTRYQGKATTFDWFFSYTALHRIISCLRKDLPCLHVGCGNSTLQEGMARDGFTHVTNVDISSVVIGQMRQLNSTGSMNTYEVMDCRNMEQFADGSFGGVLDKGTLDAVLCCKGGCADVSKYLEEVVRILAPGGVFLLISLGTPAARAKLLGSSPSAPWSTEVMLLPKPSGFWQSEALLAGRQVSANRTSGAGVDTKDELIRTLGPYSLEEASRLTEVAPGGAASELDPHDYFFAYVCRKHG